MPGEQAGVCCSYQAEVMPSKLQPLKYEITLHDKEHLMLQSVGYTLSDGKEEPSNLHVASEDYV